MIVADRQVSRVIVGLAGTRGKLPMDRLLQMKLAACGSTIWRRSTKSTQARLPSRTSDRAGSCSRAVPQEGSGCWRKRLFDVLASAWPDHHRRADHAGRGGRRETHLGRSDSLPPDARRQHGRHFVVHKFRSMRTDAERVRNWRCLGLEDRTHVTPIGRFTPGRPGSTRCRSCGTLVGER